MNCIFSGESGNSYSFALLPLSGGLPPIPGVYVACRPVRNALSPARWFPLYVGEAGDIAARVREADHDGMREAIDRGATHLGVAVVDGPRSDRLALETDLRRGLKPVCNLQTRDDAVRLVANALAPRNAPTPPVETRNTLAALYAEDFPVRRSVRRNAIAEYVKERPGAQTETRNALAALYAQDFPVRRSVRPESS